MANFSGQLQVLKAARSSSVPKFCAAWKMAGCGHCLRYTFVVNSMVCGYHEYKDIWPDPIVGEEVPCEQEVSNPHDPFGVSIKKTIGGEHKIVGHVLQRISPLCSVFIRQSGNIKCIIIGPRRY